MFIVTGGAGFIGSNIVRGLNDRGITDILVVDDLSDGRKCANLADLDVRDYLDKDDFLRRIEAGEAFDSVDAVFHEGACSTTTEWDGRLMMATNYAYSKALLDWCVAREAPFLYASSAAVYGNGTRFRETRECERPLNVYAYSKFLFDCYLRARLPDFASQVVGLRYFNVYGPREQHKGAMASVAYHFYNQLGDSGRVRLFEGADGYGPGEQKRDFVHVDDVVAVNLWLLDHPEVSGIFNVGTGRAQTFNEVARTAINWHSGGGIDYVAFPDHLRGRYQSFTEADIGALRGVGYDRPFMPVESGVPRYMDWLAQHG